MKHSIYILSMFFYLYSQAQTPVNNQVINAAGEERRLGSSDIYITDNIGEPFTLGKSRGNFLVTEGFLQPDVVSPGGFTVNVISQDLKCIDKEDDAFVSTSLITTLKNYTVNYNWTPSSACPKGNCDRIDSLKAGFYSVEIIVSYKNNIGYAKSDTVKRSVVINNATEPCKVSVFNGVTPNGDGINEVFTIDNILEFPNNEITIFNRWGQLMYSGKSYNNKERSWPTKDELSKLPASTYFYILNLGDGSKPIKGWLELMKE